MRHKEVGGKKMWGIKMKKGERRIDRKGNLGNMTMVFMFILLISLVGIGLYIGVELFFASGYDARYVDAEILAYKIENCISENGVEGLMGNSNFFRKCRLNRNMTEEYNMIKICKNSNDCVNEPEGEFDDDGKLKDGDNSKVIFKVGSNFAVCGFEGGKSNYNYPKCVLRNFKIGKDKYEIVAGGKQVSAREQTG